MMGCGRWWKISQALALLIAQPLFLPQITAATPQLALDLTLNPTTHTFSAKAQLSDDKPLAGFALAQGFEITALRADGRTISPAVAPHQGRNWYSLPAGTRKAEIIYRATLAPRPSLDHRTVLQSSTPTTDTDGSFLPASANWYPDPGVLFSYRVKLALPTGQKGLTPGELIREHDAADGYRAEFRFSQAADGIDLMAGPYVVSERKLTLKNANGTNHNIRLRTWFHPDIASLATGYLDDSARYIERYHHQISDYPFASFSIVSSPTPTGFGMPSLTYLGREVLRLPFIRASSLGHEVLHNWWGNGVYPDWANGNWSEGLTTFLADYAYKAEESDTAALDTRLAWLRDLAAIPPENDSALRKFTTRQHGISSVIGYNKLAMVFLMLQDEIGRETFMRGLRHFWKTQRFKTAGWAELEASFSQTAGKSLHGFFEQWIERTGAPDVKLVSVQRKDKMLEVKLAQSNATIYPNDKPYDLAVPLRLVFSDHPTRSEIRHLRLSKADETFTLTGVDNVRAVELDPEYRLWRRLDPAHLPAILREVFIAPNAGLLTLDDDPALHVAANALAARVFDSKRVSSTAKNAGPHPRLIVGNTNSIDAWLSAQQLPPQPAGTIGRGTAQVWAGRDTGNTPYVIISANDAAALNALQRGLPHYGRQSWLVFDNDKVIDKGIWPPAVERIDLHTNTRN